MAYLLTLGKFAFTSSFSIYVSWVDKKGKETKEKKEEENEKLWLSNRRFVPCVDIGFCGRTGQSIVHGNEIPR